MSGLFFQTGAIVGGVEVLEPAGKQGANRMWLVRCLRCNKQFKTRASRIRGLISCGCHAQTKEKLAAMLAKRNENCPHYKQYPEYAVYCTAEQRCNNPHVASYKDYGARGIEFRFSSFKEFIEHIGRRPEGMTLERINNDGHYEKGNVRWASRAEQVANRRNKKLEEFTTEQLQAELTRRQNYATLP